MKVLIDTNILIDLYAEREDFYENTKKLFNILINQNVEVFVAAYSIPTIAYILKKQYTIVEIKFIIDKIIKVFEIIPLNKLEFITAKNSNINDYEDALMEASAIAFDIDYIITRNIKDFKNSVVTAIEPQDFIINIEGGS